MPNEFETLYMTDNQTTVADFIAWLARSATTFHPSIACSLHGITTAPSKRPSTNPQEPHLDKVQPIVER